MSGGFWMWPPMTWFLQARRKRMTLDRSDVSGKHQGFWAPKPEIVSVGHLQNDAAGYFWYAWNTTERAACLPQTLSLYDHYLVT